MGAAACTAARRRRHTPVLWTIFVMVLVLWLLGVVLPSRSTHPYRPGHCGDEGCA